MNLEELVQSAHYSCVYIYLPALPLQITYPVSVRRIAESSLYLTHPDTYPTINMGVMLKPPEGTPGSAWPAIMVGLFVAFGGVLFG